MSLSNTKHVERLTHVVPFVPQTEVALNVFVCDDSPSRAAQHLADRHVVKMVLETTQILATVGQLSGITWPGQYKVTHKHHPVVKACIQDEEFLSWTACHGLALLSEYRHRYCREHKVGDQVQEAVSRLCPGGLYASEPDIDWPKAVLDEYKEETSVVNAYRLHLADKYVRWNNKARWTRRDPPDWLNDAIWQITSRRLSSVPT